HHVGIPGLRARGHGGVPARFPEGLPGRPAPDRARAARVPAARGAGADARAAGGDVILHAEQVALLSVQEPAGFADGVDSARALIGAGTRRDEWNFYRAPR